MADPNEQGIDQRTDEWRQARCGKITASGIAQLLATTKSGTPAAGRKNYIADKVAERMTGEPVEHFQSRAMLEGTEKEPMAIGAYEVFRCIKWVEPVGFVVHPDLPYSGASPDGLVSTDGLVEAKCPEKAQHLALIRFGKIDSGYLYQMQWQMECTRRQWCDFISYHPDFPDNAKLYVQRIQRDEATILRMMEATVSAEAEILEIIAAVNAYQLPA